MTRRPAGLLLLALFFACGDDDGPSDAGLTLDAARLDAARLDAARLDAARLDAARLDVGADGGLDASMDTSTDTPLDTPPDTPDAGPSCEGPPGLYAAPRCTELAEGVRAYNPRYWLWTDGADKERFVALPAGGIIDTTDPNQWLYPVGTRVWKNFLVGGMRIETRLLEKHTEGTGLNSWDTRTFAWNEAQDSVEEVIGGRENVLGTGHDIPDRNACVLCHFQTGRDDFITSFTAIQLNHADAGFSLAELNEEGWLSEGIDLADALIPGTPEESEALGYLHANCGNCHGGRFAPTGLSMWIDVGLESVDDTETYRTAVGVRSFRVDGDATIRIVAGDSAQSVAFRRMQSRMVNLQMPPIGTEVVDNEGSFVVQTWIDNLE